MAMMMVIVSTQSKVLCNQNDSMTCIKEEAAGGLAREGQVEHTRRREGRRASLKVERIVCTLTYLYHTRAWVVWLERVMVLNVNLFILRERERERESQASSALSAQNPMWGLNP